MFEYRNIPKKYLNQFAKSNKIKFSSRTEEEIINDLIKANHKEKLIYLNEQFKFSSPYMNICQPESNFPDKSKTPEKFIGTLLTEKYINRNQINTEWEPGLKQDIQICALKHDGATVYIKLVEEVTTIRKSGYGKAPYSYAHFTSVAIHFGTEELIQIRCAPREVKKYTEYVMKLMGFASPYKYFMVPKLTRENAKQLCSKLSAGVASTHFSLPTSVGSVRFNAKKGVDLDADQTYKRITDTFENDLGLPTNQTMDEIGFFTFTDPKTSIVIEATFEVNIQRSYFKFTNAVPEVVIDHVLDALVAINTLSNQDKIIAVTKE